ncbi:MAG: hybrid sensor histidine kinase/response regulator [Salinivirgaceae bacterium]
MPEKLSILYIDDEETNLNVFKNTFRREYNVLLATSAQQGLHILKTEKVDLILTDQRMPEMTGVEFLKNTLIDFPDLNRILVTGYADFGALSEAINEAKISQFVQKPWDEDQLRKLIEKNLESYLLKKENHELKNTLKENNLELEKVNAELIEYDRLKSDFLFIISHEVRTPLNSLIGPFQMLKEELHNSQLSESMVQLVYLLDVSVKRLEQFALSALHITHLKARNYELILTETNICQQINNVIDLYTKDIEDKKLNIVFDSNNSNVMLKADKELTYICVKEVFDNAVKYSKIGGTIRINLSKKPESIELLITDEGDGYSEKILQHIFEPFITEDKYSTAYSGLDLSLVKLILDAHKGRITCYNLDPK